MPEPKTWFAGRPEIFWATWVAMSMDSAKLAALTGPLAMQKGQFYNPALWLTMLPAGKTRQWSDDYASVLPHLSILETVQ